MIEIKHDPTLEMKPVTLVYLPNERSRKWRKSWFICAYTKEVAHRNGLAIQKQEGWHAAKYVEGLL